MFPCFNCLNKFIVHVYCNVLLFAGGVFFMGSQYYFGEQVHSLTSLNFMLS